MNLVWCFLVCFITSQVVAKKVHYVHWNRASPMFRIDNTDHIVDVKEYDQVNLICPVSKAGTRFPESHVIYSVSKEEYDSCRITNPKPKIVAICNQPHRLMYFTITFRSFTPTPGGLEFHPGKDYYFISTSTGTDLHRRVGGGCSTHNMKMIFKVHSSPRSSDTIDLNEPSFNTIADSSSAPVKVPKYSVVDGPVRAPKVDRLDQTLSQDDNDVVYYYHPRDVIALEKRVSPSHASGVVLNSALPFTSSSPSTTSRGPGYFSLVLVTLLTLLRRWFW